MANKFIWLSFEKFDPEGIFFESAMGSITKFVNSFILFRFQIAQEPV